jgi:hypothetical protein
MKITKSQLKQIIKEELKAVLSEGKMSPEAKIIAADSVGAVKAAIKRLPRGLLKGLPILGWGLTVIEVADFLADEYYDNYSKRLNPDDEEIKDVEQRFKDVSEPWDRETQTFPSEREEERGKTVRGRLQGTRN